MFRRVLIAGRGELAVRVARACHELGAEAVAVYSEADRDALHVRTADAAHLLGPPPAAQSYRCAEKILAAARDAGADAVHPGYGFLSEDADFAAAVEAAGLAFVGPPAAAIRAVGCKREARRRALAAGLPVVPGDPGPWPSDAALTANAARLGFPLLVKAAAGGGGRGMRRVDGPADLSAAVAAAAREAEAAFGDGRLLLERLVARGRHVEVQVLADHHGAARTLGTRDCSVQRRHQKVVEEAPAADLPAGLAARLEADSLHLTATLGYRGAGTVEWLVAPDGAAYFLEVNPRLQVEHPVSEEIFGLDLVKAQLRLAAGQPLAALPGSFQPRGHALECRLYAEDPAAGFLPSPGRLLAFRTPVGGGIRVDAGYAEGDVVPAEYDALLAKVVVWGGDRAEARARMRYALRNLTVLGVRTNLALLRAVLDHPAADAGPVHTAWLEERLDELTAPPPGALPLEFLAAAAAAAGVTMADPTAAARRPAVRARSAAADPWRSLGRWSNVGGGR
jgi:acetyl/propionyl-CoA carboxylase alpha subunit